MTSKPASWAAMAYAKSSSGGYCSVPAFQPSCAIFLSFAHTLIACTHDEEILGKTLPLGLCRVVSYHAGGRTPQGTSDLEDGTTVHAPRALFAFQSLSYLMSHHFFPHPLQGSCYGSVS